MPEMNGQELANKILAIYPNIRILYMSGYSPDIIAHHGSLNDNIRYIQKPFFQETLGAKVREVLDSYNDKKTHSLI